MVECGHLDPIGMTQSRIERLARYPGCPPCGQVVGIGKFRTRLMTEKVRAGTPEQSPEPVIGASLRIALAFFPAGLTRIQRVMADGLRHPVSEVGKQQRASQGCSLLIRQVSPSHWYSKRSWSRLGRPCQNSSRCGITR